MDPTKVKPSDPITGKTPPGEGQQPDQSFATDPKGKPGDVTQGKFDPSGRPYADAVENPNMKGGVNLAVRREALKAALDFGAGRLTEGGALLNLAKSIEKYLLGKDD